MQYAIENFKCPLGIRLRKSTAAKNSILMEGNDALGLGCIYGGATVAAWYPITPSTSVVDAFEKYAKRLRIDAGTGDRMYAIAQAEDELAAIGMAVGANWNGARSFTATSGPGVSLMSEFLGVRGRALVGRECSGEGAHCKFNWGKETGQARLARVAGQVALGPGGAAR